MKTGIVLIATLLVMTAPQLVHAATAVRDARVVTPEGLHAVGPPLLALQTKLADPNWLVAWLLKPAHLQARPLMRNFRLTAEEAQTLAKYLYAGSVPVRSAVKWQGGDAHAGEKLFVTRGCRGCHAIEAAETSISPRVPNLAGIGIKVRGDWLFNWLKAPRAYNPNTAMPQLALSDDDIRHLVAFLLSHRERADVVAQAPRFNPRAASSAALTLIGRYDCAKCHLIKGVQTIEPTTRWAFVPPACASCHEPSGSAAPQSRNAAAESDATETALRNGRLLIAYYNCHGCHRIEGSGGALADHLERKTFAPPALDGEGARVQTSWLIDFLRHPTNLRPWLEVRMPDFGLSEAEATELAKYFAALAHVVPADEPREEAAPELSALGPRRFAHFRCAQCHPASLGAQLPTDVDPEDLSINLTLAKVRLRPSWIREFLARPKAVVGTQTRMPAVFYTTDGIPKVEHPEQDIAAITAHLLEMTELPATAAALDGSAGYEPTPPIDWRTFDY